MKSTSPGSAAQETMSTISPATTLTINVNNKTTPIRTAQLALMPIQNPSSLPKSSNPSGGPTPRGQSSSRVNNSALGHAGAQVINAASSKITEPLSISKHSPRPHHSQQPSTSTLNTTTTSREPTSARATSTVEEDVARSSARSNQTTSRVADSGGSRPHPGNNTTATKQLSFQAIKAVGQGAFGTVYLAKVIGGNRPDDEIVAIKKVKLEPHYENRELILLKDIQTL